MLGALVFSLLLIYPDADLAHQPMQPVDELQS
jgi:hypothetical protein